MLGAPQTRLPELGGPEWRSGTNWTLGAGGDGAADCAVAPVWGSRVRPPRAPTASDSTPGTVGAANAMRPRKPDRKAAALCRELRKWWAALWTSARVEGVEPTNNISERALRPAVWWRKGSFGSDSAAGSRFAAGILTVAATCRQQGRSLLAFLVAAGQAVLQGTARPSLLTPDRGR